MRRRVGPGAAAIAVIAAALIVAGCGGGGATNASSGYSSAASSGTPAAGSATKVAIRHTALGSVLVDGQGKTLYLFEGDKGTASRCTGACSSIWPPLTSAAKPMAGQGIASAKLGTAKRSDGTTEITYAGHPLYTYVGDAKAGDTKGQGLDQFGAEWYVLSPSGSKIDNG
jgi:predicted lipoprotein with Yx(FWY)xxD motif